jgi:hypothetical protein
MSGRRIARRARQSLALGAALGLGSGCDVSSVVGENESALGVLRCGEDAPLPRCDTGACVVRDLEPAQTGSTAIAVDDDTVYCLRDASSIVTLPVGGGTQSDLASSGMGVSRMAVDATHLYWSEFGRRIFRVPKTGGSPEVVADIQGHPGVIALDETEVYATLTDTNEMVMTPKEPGTATFLPNQDAPFWVVTDRSHVYWINQGTAAQTGALLRAPLGDLTHPEVLLQGLDSPVTLALSESDAYFVAGKELVRVAKDSGDPEVVLDDLDETKSLATYSDSVYLTGIAGFLRVRASATTTLDTRTTLGVAVACSGVFTTGWLTPALLRYAP